MDRLSAYAAKDNVERSVEERSKAEVEAARKLVEGLAVSKLEPASHASSQPNGESAERREESAESAESAPIADSIPSETTARPIASTSTSTTAVSESAAEDTETAKHVVPNYSKLFEIFYQQVLGLTRSQRLSLADTIALLVSLLNLAM